MSTNLSIAQFAQITLGKTEKPLHLADVLKVNKQSVMSLKGSIENLSRTETFVFVAMLCREDLVNLWGNTPAEVASSISTFRSGFAHDYALGWTQWAQAWLSGNQAAGDGNSLPSYTTLYSILKAAGASIFYLSPQGSLPSNIPNLGPGTMPPWTVVGINGTFASLANLGGQILPFWPGGANGWTDADWNAVTAFASGGNDLLIAPAELLPAMWLASQGLVNNLPYGNMILLSGS